ncbi:MAG TPA: hypothetical protein VII94_00180, partial [Candidatus Saccharimonadales bacterium]
GTFPTSNLTTRIIIGYINQQQALLGNIAEILVYKGVHNEAQRDVIAAYMSQRYDQSWINPIFTPGDLSPLAWFSSDVGVTNVSGKASQWLDQSGNSHTLTQGNSSFRPVINTGGAGNKPYLTFASASGTFLSNTSFTRATSSPIETFVVATTSVANTGQNQFLLDLGNLNNSLLQPDAYLNVYNGTELPASIPLVANALFVSDMTNDGSGNGTLAMNGGTPASGSVGTNAQTTYLTVGSYGSQSGESWSGNVYEVLVLPGPISAGQRADLIDYFNAKYSLSAPASLNPAGWWRADAGVTVVGGLVTGVLDQSGNGHNLTVNTVAGATSPAFSSSAGPNNTPCFQYTELTTMGLSESTLTTAEFVDVFIVAKTKTATAASNDWLVCLGNAAANGYAEIYQSSGTVALYQTQNGGSNNNSSTMTVNQPFIVESQFLGNSSSSINLISGGTTSGQKGSVGSGGSDTGFTLGHAGGASSIPGTFSWPGDISECIVFSYVLSDYQRQQVIAYLSAKYGILV